MNNQFNNVDLKQKHDKPFIKSIELVKTIDEYPDLSFLEQDYNDVTNKKEREKYLEQDKTRLEEYNNGSWWMMYIYAKTRILIPLNLLGYAGNNIEYSYQMVEIRSGGLGGIDSDIDDSELKHELENQKHELIKILNLLNVDIPKDIEIKEVNE
jgi:hypothetical protein